MLRIIRWWKLDACDFHLCEGYEINDDHPTVTCHNEVTMGCETDNGSWWKVCGECAKRLGFRNATGE